MTDIPCYFPEPLQKSTGLMGLTIPADHTGIELVRGHRVYFVRGEIIHFTSPVRVTVPCSIIDRLKH